MDKASHYIKLSEVEGILQNHVDSLFGDSCVEWLGRLLLALSAEV